MMEQHLINYNEQQEVIAYRTRNYWWIKDLVGLGLEAVGDVCQRCLELMHDKFSCMLFVESNSEPLYSTTYLDVPRIRSRQNVFAECSISLACISNIPVT